MADSFLNAIEAGASGSPVFSQEGLDLVKTFESFKPGAYYDLGKNKGTLTVGYGFTNSDIPNLKPGYKMDKKQAEDMLPSLLNKKYGPAVLDNVKVPLNDQQYSALTSFAYNVGPTAFKNSTLVKKLNSGDTDGAAEEFDKWVYAGGKPVSGLAKRRAAEKALFKGDTQALGAILEAQKFSLPERQGFSESVERKMPKEKVTKEQAEFNLPATVSGKKLSKGISEQLLPATAQGPSVEKSEAENLLNSFKTTDWAKVEKDLKESTKDLAPIPSLDGSDKKNTTTVAKKDPFEGYVSPPMPAPSPENSTVNSILKLAGKQPLDLSKVGENTKVEFTFDPLSIFAGIGEAFKDTFSEGGAMTPMPDNPDNSKPKEKAEEPKAPDLKAPALAEFKNLEYKPLENNFKNLQSGLDRASGLAPIRKG